MAACCRDKVDKIPFSKRKKMTLGHLMWRRVSLLRLILALRPLRPLVAPVVTPEAERFAWQMILETMVHLMAQHFSWPVEDGVSPRPGVLADIGCSFSPCCHVPLPPRPQASVWELKGTQKFTCCRHPFCPFFYFFMTTQINLTPLSQIPPGLQTGWQYGSQYRRVLWLCLALKGGSCSPASLKRKTTLMSIFFFGIAVIHF